MYLSDLHLLQPENVLQTRRHPGLDAIRGFAFLFVLHSHYLYSTLPKPCTLCLCEVLLTAAADKPGNLCIFLRDIGCEAFDICSPPFFSTRYFHHATGTQHVILGGYSFLTNCTLAACSSFRCTPVRCRIVPGFVINAACAGAGSFCPIPSSPMAETLCISSM